MKRYCMFVCMLMLSFLAAPTQAGLVYYNFSFTFPDLSTPIYDQLETVVPPGSLVYGSIVYDTANAVGSVTLTEGSTPGVTITTSLDGVVVQSPSELHFAASVLSVITSWQRDFGSNSYFWFLQDLDSNPSLTAIRANPFGTARSTVALSDFQLTPSTVSLTPTTWSAVKQLYLAH